MSQRKWLLLMFLAIVFSSLAGFLGASFAHTSSASAAPPAKQISKTLTLTAGFRCANPYPFPTVQADFDRVTSGTPNGYCIIDTTPLSSQPLSMACVWTPAVSSTPTYGGAWRDCYINEIATDVGLDVIWDSQQNQLELLIHQDSNSVPFDTTVVYSAFL